MITIYLLEFLIFSFLGWLLDSGYRSITERKWINAGYFKGPLCPIYGFGGLALLLVFTYFSFLPLFVLFMVAGVSLVMVEYLGGVFAEHILHLKLWDYSSSHYHLGGHVDLLHSSYWFFLSVSCYYLLFPFMKLIENTISVPEFIELPLLVIFVMTGIGLTVRRNPLQFLEIKGRVIDMTVEKYGDLFTNIEHMYKAGSATARHRLQKMIEQQLRNTGAYLKRMKP
ncbi:MAG TPA: putative ABC transporter permease [Candidatus Nanoarchaeia archaeon]|nr:putative ABC transporter permease [Candidatus Nanoarchaeia archaeon]